MKLETLGEISDEDTIFYMEQKGIGAKKKDIEKLHRVLNHKGVRNMEFAFRNAGRLDAEVSKMIKETVENCSICQKNGRSRSKPSVAIPRATDFNSIVTLDLKEMGKSYILWMVDAFSRTLFGAVMKDKKAETILEKLELVWINIIGFPLVGFYADNGGEFRNYKMEEFVSKIGIKIEFSPSYSPWSNGLNERNHYSADRIVRKLMDEGVSLELAMSRACWTHNTNIMVNGYNPLTLMTGKSVVILGISTGNIATESRFEDEAVREAMENCFEITKKFREIEFGSKIDKALKTRMKGHENMIIQKGDEVFYQTNNEKAWLGPAEVTDVDNNYVFVKTNGDRRKVPKCNMKLNVKKVRVIMNWRKTIKKKMLQRKRKKK